ncbi:MAG: hypothetical protein JXB34_14840 [Bacteroidales bacterium]|nr:hypothetical protein [Bacteroidales bacterium]
MKQSILLVFFFLFGASAFSQRKADIGITGGTGYYQGDINPTFLFYSPKYNIGPVFRYNFNGRYSLRIQAIYANITGSDSDFDYVVTKRKYPVSFSNHMVNVAAQAEYNFFKYQTGINAGEWSPYMFGGFGYSIVFSGISPSHLTMPFGIGAKLNVTRRMSAGVQWGYNKTFNDKFDGAAWPVGNNGTLMFNNDWYSFLNIFITYKFFKFAADCPTYD